MIYFADTSAFAKRYVPEVGSTWVLSWIAPTANNIVYISGISLVEFSSIIARKLGEGHITQSDAHQLKNAFLFHTYREYAIVSISASVIQTAQQLVTRYPLRTLDSLQLACALNTVRYASSMPTFVTADQRLFAAAAAEGFPVEDPNAHP